MAQDSAVKIDTDGSTSLSGTYWTGCQAHLFLNGTSYLGEAAGISYNATTNKTPIYGHRSEVFDRTARGTTSVSGLLLFNLSDFRYTSAAIGLAVGDLITPEEETIVSQRQFLLQRIPSLSGVGLRETEWIYSQAMSAITPHKGDAALSIISGQSARITESETGIRDPLAEKLRLKNLASAAFHTKSFDIVIAIGDPNEISRDFNVRTNVTMKRLVGVEIIGEAVQIQANDEVIMEGYPFIAKRVDFNQEEILANFSKSLENERIDRFRNVLALLEQAYEDSEKSFDLESARLSGFTSEKAEDLPQGAEAALSYRLQTDGVSLLRWAGYEVPPLLMDPNFADKMEEFYKQLGPGKENFINKINRLLDGDISGGGGGFVQLIKGYNEGSTTLSDDEQKFGAFLSDSSKYRGAVTTSTAVKFNNLLVDGFNGLGLSDLSIPTTLTRLLSTA